MAVFQKILAGTCELTTSAFTPVTTMPIFTGDDNGAVISVSFTEDGAAYTIPLDVDVKAYLFYDSKNAMTQAYTMTIDDDTASLVVPDEFTAVSGNPQCIIMMVDVDANVTKTCAFSMPVKRTTSETVIYLAPPSPDTVVYIGRAPYVCEAGTWCVWDNDTRQYVDTGISAAGNYTVFVKWSAINPTQDSDISDTPNDWMGVYTGQLVIPPTTYTSYQWYKVKGEKGDDGVSAYVHIRWGTSATPETLLTEPDAYIGIASTSSATAPADYTGYSWYLYKGAKGDQGDAGTSAYVHIRWGTSLTPATLLTTPDEYIGIASTSSATAPTDYTGYTWYKYKGEPGETVAVIDNLTSDSTTAALSAAQGKALDLAKAAKAPSPTAGNIATLDASGNPVDSTKSLSDLATSAQGIPTGGAIGQALIKSGSPDFATEWAAVGRSNPNLLHNWDWRTPVNQRAATGAVSNAYCIDRWIGNGTVTPSDGNYVTLANGTTMTQRIEILPAKLYSKDVVFSVMVGGQIQTAQFTFPASATGSADSETLTGVSVEVGFYDYGSGNETKLETVNSQYVPYVKITANTEINIEAVKLEKGTVSTLKNSAPADYGQQLLTCQRFYYQLKDISASYYGAFTAISSNVEYILCGIQFPVRMRIIPTVTLIYVAAWNSSETNMVDSGVTAQGVTEDGISYLKDENGGFDVASVHYIKFKASAVL